METKTASTASATRNACKVCAPLGASLAYRGIEGCVPLLHGGQGCATYIRRYLISHFREPVDIASSSFSETTAIFGGHDNFIAAVGNIVKQYKPSMIGAATTCLSETMGEDVASFAREAERLYAIPVAHASTPSYSATHSEGFRLAVRALVERFAQAGPATRAVAIFPGMVSPADLRHIKELVSAFGLKPILVPDYSESLDGGNWEEFRLLPGGGTTIDELKSLGSVLAAIDFAAGTHKTPGPLSAPYLESKFGVPAHHLPPLTGVTACDDFMALLENISGQSIVPWIKMERARLLDAYVDGHKYFYGKQVAVFGDEDLVWGLAGFLTEIGAIPSVCATGGDTDVLPELPLSVACQAKILQDTDFDGLMNALRENPPDMLAGTSKGFNVAKTLGVPLVRAGFPIHDRFGAGRNLQVGYRGTLALFDTFANTILANAQDSCDIGYKYY